MANEKGPFPLFHPATIGGATAVSDNFNRANGELGANWTQVEDSNLYNSGGHIVVQSNQAISYNTFIAGYALAVWSANSFNNNQYSEGYSNVYAPIVRATASPASYYVYINEINSGYDENNDIWWSSSSLNLYKVVNSVWTSLYNTLWDYEESELEVPPVQEFKNYGAIRVEISGTTLNLYILVLGHGDTKTLLFGPHTDSSISSGNAGIIYYCDNWYGGDL